jgi:prophage antirepressor-like protein
MTTELIKLGSRDILGKTVTAFGTVENPLFLAKDVAEWIEHSDVSMMLKSIDDDEKTLIQTILVSGQQAREYWFLTEAGLYEVLFLSRKPVAKEFKKGVKQLLHDLRTGKAQVMPTGMALVQAAMQFLVSENAAKDKTISAQQSKIACDAPKVEFANQVGECINGKGIREFGLIFRQNGAGFGQNGFVQKLLDDGYIYRDQKGKLRPYAEYTDEDGLFWTETVVIDSPKGTFETVRVKVTGKGQQYFLDKYMPLSPEVGGEFPEGYFNEEAA